MTQDRLFLRSALVAIFFAATLSAEAESRSWTNDAGKTIQAELVDVEGDKAVLNMSGNNFPVPINTLSEADQEFIKNWKNLKLLLQKHWCLN